MSHAITINESIRQMDKGQDQTFSGTFVDAETGEPGKYGFVADGHGKNQCIDCLRAISQETMDGIIGSAAPVENLAQYINEYGYVTNNNSSGATMCLIKVYSDRVVAINCGDSQAAIYKNGELVFLSEEHNCDNEKERERIAKKRVIYENSPNIEVVSEIKMVGITSRYAIFPPYLRLASTQALGHNGRTGLAPDVTVVPFKPDDKVHVVIGSDGLWDMVLKQNVEEMNSFTSKTSAELVEFAVVRWLQPWNMHKDKITEVHVLSRFEPHQCDDVCVVKIDILPVEATTTSTVAATAGSTVAATAAATAGSQNKNNIFEPFPIIINNIQNILRAPE
jgi:serine/threonine protein phosphatase PrpC